MVLLEELSSPFGGEAMFYIAGAFTGRSSLLFLTLPSAHDRHDQGKVNTSNTSKTEENPENSKPKLHDPMTPMSPEHVSMPLMPSAFTLSCSCLGVLAVGLEAGFAFCQSGSGQSENAYHGLKKEYTTYILCIYNII